MWFSSFFMQQPHRRQRSAAKAGRSFGICPERSSGPQDDAALIFQTNASPQKNAFVLPLRGCSIAAKCFVFLARPKFPGAFWISY